jgi:hypothetical protein
LGENLGKAAVADITTLTVPREVRAKADAVVLLAFADEAALVQLAQDFYELHVILGGKVRQPAQELRKENRSLVYFVTNESRALGILQLQLAAGSPPKPLRNEIRLLHDKIPQDKSFRQLAQEYRDEVRRTKLAVDDPSKAGADRCGCVLWPPTSAVNAVSSVINRRRRVDQVRTRGCLRHLVHRKADADPKCVGCHTIGLAACRATAVSSALKTCARRLRKLSRPGQPSRAPARWRQTIDFATARSRRRLPEVSFRRFSDRLIGTHSGRPLNMEKNRHKPPPAATSSNK